MTEHRYTPPPPVPASPETEMAILGAALERKTSYQAAAAIFGDTQAFHEKKHAEIWEALCRWYVDHDCRPDGTFLVNQFGCDGHVSLAAECVNAACLSPNVEYHCNELMRLWALRRTRDDAATLARCCDGRDVAALLTTLRDIGATVRAAGLLEGVK
jgi:replicative DNA helicase